MHLYTIGHSTRSYKEFEGILKRYEIKLLVDVRSFPTSRRNPHFSKEELERKLPEGGIEYIWMGTLGGYRNKGLGNKSPNKGWREEGFRNYADYMMTSQFKKGMEKLLRLSEGKGVAYMCAERFYWRCHRRLISDYLVSKGHRITHIIDEDKILEHKLPDFAKVIKGELRYPSFPPFLPLYL
jgi:uncharacterized protein (DUF488 family)